MNKEEIKEILDFKEDADYKRLSIEDILLLKECITNLQEENKRIKKDLATYDNALISCTYEKLSLMVTIDKAIECINYYAIENSDYEKIYNIEEETLLNILGDKDG